jgi:hypothetical protein
MVGISKAYDEKEGWVQNRKGRDQIGDLCLIRRVILKRILKICRVDSYAS